MLQKDCQYSNRTRNAHNEPAVNEFQVISQVGHAGIRGEHESERKKKEQGEEWERGHDRGGMGETWVPL